MSQRVIWGACTSKRPLNCGRIVIHICFVWASPSRSRVGLRSGQYPKLLFSVYSSSDTSRCTYCYVFRVSMARCSLSDLVEAKFVESECTDQIYTCIESTTSLNSKAFDFFR